MKAKEIEQLVAAEVARQLKKIEHLLNRPVRSVPEWVDAAVICDMLKIDKRSLDRYRHKGLIGSSKFGGKVFYDRHEILRYLTEHKETKPPQR